ncbi:hypothetical protein TNIN_94621 [Trichonephila inaurata madagascariensis]|uniref:Uncharacterized protein n=1 Tax=Trichonephila inaurata madagascariensis TaxID=2747483 RepID=A0A8X6IYY3_9ARAC|nr:hypothetical protein TNIN_94621 [Trichonephila inaurata madagascariensis]
MKRSVMTGIPELLEARYLSRFIRICVFICCLVGFLYYTISFLFKYWTYPTVMDVVVEYPEIVEIPAVTVCTYNGNYIYDSNISVPAISAYDLPDLTRLDYKDLGVRAEDLIESCEFVDAAGTPVVCGNNNFVALRSLGTLLLDLLGVYFEYQLVKQECEKEGIYIPKYRKYQKLMKTYKAAAIARAKKKEEEENAESSISTSDETQ